MIYDRHRRVFSLQGLAARVRARLRVKHLIHALPCLIRRSYVQVRPTRTPKQLLQSAHMDEYPPRLCCRHYLADASIWLLEELVATQGKQGVMIAIQGK